MPRIPYFDPATAPERVRQDFDRLQVKLNLFRMVANAGTLFPHWIRLGGAILGRMRLDARLRELVILRVSRLVRCDYEWTQHIDIAKGCGISDEQLAALDAGLCDAPGFDEVDRLVLRFTDEVVRDVRVSDATFAEAAQRFSAQEIVELLMTAGFYRMVAGVIEGAGVEIETPKGSELMGGLERRSGDL